MGSSGEMVRMNYKSVAKEIYQASQQEPSTSAATRYRKQAISGYEQEDRVMLRAYVDNLLKHRTGTQGNFGSEFYGK